MNTKDEKPYKPTPEDFAGAVTSLGLAAKLLERSADLLMKTCGPKGGEPAAQFNAELLRLTNRYKGATQTGRDGDLIADVLHLSDEIVRRAYGEDKGCLPRTVTCEHCGATFDVPEEPPPDEEPPPCEP